MTYRIAGDIGGTKTTLVLFRQQQHGAPRIEREQTFTSKDFLDFEGVLTKFLPDPVQIEAACFGVAGPVVDQCCQLTNLTWQITGDTLKKHLGTQRVKLLNDLEAMALGMLCLGPEDWIELNPQAQVRSGNRAVIAAGTGLGEAILYWDGQCHHPIATEGGHCDFAPKTEQQDQLLNYLRRKYGGHVSFERLVSGMGLSHIYDFLVDYGYVSPCSDVVQCDEQGGSESIRHAIISERGLSGNDPACSETIRIFVTLYGAEAGNLALKSLATGGLFIGGGIGPIIRPVMESGLFMEAFRDKGRFRELLDTVSVKLALNPRTPLMGAMNYFR